MDECAHGTRRYSTSFSFTPPESRIAGRAPIASNQGAADSRRLLVEVDGGGEVRDTVRAPPPGIMRPAGQLRTALYVSRAMDVP